MCIFVFTIYKMLLSTFDWIIIGSFFVISFLIGLYASRKSGKSFEEYFLAGGNMPWWLLGISMVATTFAADTPNLVADIVRKGGVSGNWVWWAFLLTGMLTVFVYAKLWKRSGVLTDLEFYELRYSGKPAAFLRGFRALYLGIIFNCMVMAVVILAGIKIGGILLGATPIQVVLVAGSITVIYTMLGGLRGVILTDFFQFGMAMFGGIAAAVYLLNIPEVGGFSTMLQHPNLSGKLHLLPDFSDTNTLIPLFIIPLAVQWWSTWYPGAEPGGGGYIAQRMLSAKSEKDATGATLLFNIAHYALRPWPWILVALASLIVFPDLESIKGSFPNLNESIINDDLAYPAMLSLLPTGLLGLVIASLIAAFMSTISTHLNWGSSYVAHDFYKRFVKPDATDKQLVGLGRISTVLLMVFASIIALGLESALEGFNIILQIGAGTGLIYILRWFWWRINAYTEIAGMAISFLVAVFLEKIYPTLGHVPVLEGWHKLLLGVAITTIGWLLVTFLTKPTKKETLENFYLKVQPDKAGWKPIADELAKKGKVVSKMSTLAAGVAAMFVATILVYSLLFGVGYLIYGNWMNTMFAGFSAAITGYLLFKLWPKLQMD